MKITVGQTYAVSERGMRRNNEDAIYPQPENVSLNDRLFLVCDGVGGAEKGEIASMLACESIRTYFKTYLTDNNPSAEFIQKAIKYTEARFDNYVERHPESSGMATTLTLVYIGTKGVTLAHVGDSRIYYCRKSSILHKTIDHSLVNTYVQMGQISEEEAVTHPRKNVITRAIQSSKYPTEADVSLLTDIQEKDCILMCTDGVFENFSCEELAKVSALQPVDMKNSLLDKCLNNTKDNFSFYILPINKVQHLRSVSNNIRAFFYSLI